METSKNKIFARSSTNMSTDAKIASDERRKRELEKAHAVLKKAQKTMSNTDKENIQKNNNNTSSLLNISDYVKDETIQLVLNDSSSFVSFEPKDFTGRSTLNQRAANLSVSDILLSSCAPKMREIGERMRRSSVASTTLSSFNGNLSLPRTADMCSLTDRSSSLVGNEEEEEDFKPAELMHSQLINDEIAWAQERTNMPNVALSEEAKKKLGVCNLTDANVGVSLPLDDTNLSMGRYFIMRSENISNIVSQASGRSADRQPVCLVDESIPKDSGNATNDSSYSFSLSGLDRALLDFNFQAKEDDTSLMIEGLLQQGKLEQTKIKQNLSIGSSENKENINPGAKNDTLSFTESLFNNSLTKSRSEHERLPLSPLPIQPAIEVTPDTEADIDEWPSSPIVSPFRRKRLTKSPKTSELQLENLCSTRLDLNHKPTTNATLVYDKDSPSPKSLQPPCRTVSRCSSNSEFTHREGRVVPLKVTTLELCWPSTKLRTNVRKSMQIKNIFNKRLAVRIDINGPGFQILNMPTSKIWTMQSQECRTININFCPTVTGAAHGMLAFYAPNSQHQHVVPFLEIPLYGYGGHCRLVPHHVSRGPLGPLFINMGNVCDLGQPLEKQFMLCNSGTLPGFLSIIMDTVSLKFRGLSDAFTVSPKQCLINSGESVCVSIVFQPRREDIKKISKHLNQQVLTLAHLRLISGDEPNRQRMRKLFSQLSMEERGKLQTTSLQELWLPWPNERNYSKELRYLREQPTVVFDLLTSMKVHEIALTLSADENLEETLDISSIYCPDADETVLFRTVCAAGGGGGGGVEVEEDLADVSELAVCEPTWSVSPSIIEFDFFAERRKTAVSLFVRNNYKSRQFFEVSCSHKHLLTFTPHEGYVAPEGGQVEIQINTKYQQPPGNLKQQSLFIMVHIENEKIVVPVNIPKDNYIS